jgi:hypothetical protein
MIRGTAIIPRTNGGYSGEILISGFPYTIRIEREDGAVRVTISDVPMSPEELAASDALHGAYLGRLGRKVAG